MRKTFEAIWSSATLAFAVALVAFILWSALRAHAHMWRQVAARYRGKPSSTSIALKLEVAVFAARGLRGPDAFRNSEYRHYAGLFISVHDQGLALSLVPPFNIMCPALFLPFDHMELKQTDWALWRDPFAIRMRQLPHIDIIIGRETVRWLREYVDKTPFGLGV